MIKILLSGSSSWTKFGTFFYSDPDWILSSEFRPKLDASVGSNERGYVSLTSERLSRERDSRVRQREQLELVDEYAGCGSSEERKDVK